MSTVFRAAETKGTARQVRRHRLSYLALRRRLCHWRRDDDGSAGTRDHPRIRVQMVFMPGQLAALTPKKRLRRPARGRHPGYRLSQWLNAIP